MWFPFIPGVSKNNQRQYSVKEATRNEEIEQGRKNIARRIVKTKKNLLVTEALDSPKQDHYRKLLARQQNDMRKYLDDHKDEATFNLKRDQSLEKVYTPLSTLIKDYKE